MRIKICHICDRITGQSDGVYTHLLMLLNNIDKSRFEQIVIFQGGEIVENELRKNGIEVFTIPELNKRVSIKGFNKIYKILRNEQVDIIQAHLIKPYILSGLMNIILKKMLIFNYNGLFLSSVYHNPLERFILQILHFLIVFSRSVQISVVPSQNSKNILTAETKIFPRVEVYYNGFSSSEARTTDKTIIDKLQELKQEYFIVGVVARIEIQKRIDTALNILKELKRLDKNVFFVFFGDGPLEKEMIQLSNILGIMDRLQFWGYVEGAKNYIKYFDTLLLTSDWEGFPLTIWEAMAAGIPIISTDVGGIKEILEKEKCGLIYPKGDSDRAIRSIIELMDNNSYRMKLGENGKKAIETKYNRDQFISFFDALYSNLLSSK